MLIGTRLSSRVIEPVAKRVTCTSGEAGEHAFRELKRRTGDVRLLHANKSGERDGLECLGCHQHGRCMSNLPRAVYKATNASAGALAVAGCSGPTRPKSTGLHTAVPPHAASSTRLTATLAGEDLLVSSYSPCFVGQQLVIA